MPEEEKKTSKLLIIIGIVGAILFFGFCFLFIYAIFSGQVKPIFVD